MGGGGYQWMETPKTSLSSSFGLASLHERFENQPDGHSELSFQSGYAFSRQLCKTTKFLNDLTYYPSLDEFSDFFLTSTGELRTNLTKSMFANFRAIFNYDATPAVNRGSADVKYLLGIGLSF